MLNNFVYISAMIVFDRLWLCCRVTIGKIVIQTYLLLLMLRLTVAVVAV